MRRKYTLLPWLPPHPQEWLTDAASGRQAPANILGGRGNTETDLSQTRTEQKQTRTEQKRRARSEAFRAQTFPHMDALYSDALCLTSCPEDAVALVVEAYKRALKEYDRFRHRRVPGHLRTRSTRAWLYGYLHGAFCDRILGLATPDAKPMGGQS